MAKKYHIDAHGKIVPCSAFLRKCPRTDYSSEEAAYSALYLQKESNRLEEARANVESIMRNTKAPSSFIAADFSGQGLERDPRAYAQRIDKTFFETGEYPQKAYAEISLNRALVDNNRVRTKLSLHRIPVADYDNGVITGEWTLETDQRNSAQQIPPLELDLENDYEEEKERAERYIRDVVIRTSPPSARSEDIEFETNQMMEQFENAYVQVEEEASGPYKIFEKNPGLGTFAGSDPFTIKVDANYNDTLFRGKTFEQFVSKNPDYRSITPELNVQVYDNENGKSDSSWRLVNHQGNWYLQTVIDGGKPNPVKLNGAEDAYEKMNYFVKNHMLTNSSTIAEQKARYAADLITEIDNAMAHSRAKKDERWGTKKAQEDSDSNKKLFGKSSDSTMNDILNLFA